MGRLVCDECGGYYELQDGEKPEDFSSECQCGGALYHMESVDDLQQKPKKGFMGFWNGQSTGGKIIISIMGLCVVFGLIAMVAAMSSPSTVPVANSSVNNVAPQPYDTDSVTMSEEKYIAQMQVITKNVRTVLNDASITSDQVANGMITFDLARTRFESYGNQIDNEITKLDHMVPPSRFLNTHTLFTSAVHDISKSIDLVVEGINQNDVSKINQASVMMNSATSKIDQANDEFK